MNAKNTLKRLCHQKEVLKKAMIFSIESEDFIETQDMLDLLFEVDDLIEQVEMDSSVVKEPWFMDDVEDIIDEVDFLVDSSKYCECCEENL